MATIRLDSRGMEQMLKSSGVRKAVANAGKAVASRAVYTTRNGEEIPVEVTDFTTSTMRMNRAATAVSLAHPAGPAIQAKNGTLTKAASEAGLKVKPRMAK